MKNGSKKSNHQEQQHGSGATSGIPKVKSNTADVLYQKIGDQWYAFSVIGDEVYMGKVPESAIDANNNIKNDDISNAA